MRMLQTLIAAMVMASVVAVRRGSAPDARSIRSDRIRRRSSRARSGASIRPGRQSSVTDKPRPTIRSAAALHVPARHR
jgi:hypothetical protein